MDILPHFYIDYMEQEQLYQYRNYLYLKGYKDRTVQKALAITKQYLNCPQETDFIGYILNWENKNRPGQKLSQGTLNHYWFCLKIYFTYLKETTGESPAVRIPCQKSYITPTGILSIGEIKELFAQAKTVREQCVLVLLYHLGLRLGEALNVETGDMDWDKGLLFIPKSKTGRQRQIPVNTSAGKVIQAYIQEERPIRDSPKLLQGLQGDLGKDGVTRILRILVKRARICKRVYPHLLRHSIASHLLQRGMELQHVGRFLGHTCLESTQRYTHLIHEDI